MTDAILKLRNLTVDLPPGADRRHAVEDVTLDVGGAGQAMGGRS